VAREFSSRATIYSRAQGAQSEEKRVENDEESNG
jgi:hypothetical protein